MTIQGSGLKLIAGVDGLASIFHLGIRRTRGQSPHVLLIGVASERLRAPPPGPPRGRHLGARREPRTSCRLPARVARAPERSRTQAYRRPRPFVPPPSSRARSPRRS